MIRIKSMMRHAAPLVFAALAALSTGMGPAGAGENVLAERLHAAAPPGASGWDKSFASRLRLIAARTGVLAMPEASGTPEAGAAMDAGIEITLDKGWKTYWRNPGDTGVAPMFDFSRSENVARVEVAYPMPARFDDPGDISFGYTERVVFPLRVVPRSPDAPVRLVADVVYGACEDLCIPVEAHAELAFPAGAAATTTFAADIADWRARAPAPRGAVLEHVMPVTDEDGARLHVVVRAPAPLTNPVLIAELTGGPARAWLGTPAVEIEGTRAEFRFPVKIRKGGPGLHGGAQLTFTLADTTDDAAEKPQWAQQFEYHLAAQ